MNSVLATITNHLVVPEKGLVILTSVQVPFSVMTIFRQSMGISILLTETTFSLHIYGSIVLRLAQLVNRLRCPFHKNLYHPLDIIHTKGSEL